MTQYHVELADQTEVNVPVAADEVNRWGLQAVLDEARERGIGDETNPIRAVLTPEGERVTQL